MFKRVRPRRRRRRRRKRRGKGRRRAVVEVVVGGGGEACISPDLAKTANVPPKVLALLKLSEEVKYHLGKPRCCSCRV
jgi:hypothetical protein